MQRASPFFIFVNEAAFSVTALESMPFESMRFFACGIDELQYKNPLI